MLTKDGPLRIFGKTVESDIPIPEPKVLSDISVRVPVLSDIDVRTPILSDIDVGRYYILLTALQTVRAWLTQFIRQRRSSPTHAYISLANVGARSPLGKGLVEANCFVVDQIRA